MNKGSSITGNEILRQLESKSNKVLAPNNKKQIEGSKLIGNEGKFMIRNQQQHSKIKENILNN